MGAEGSALGAESKSFFRREWEGWKCYFGERLPIFDYYSRFVRRETPLPSWSAADVDEFIASDPVYGPTLSATRKASKCAAVGGVIGAISTAVFSWKYSRSPHGALLSFGGGAILGLTFGQEFGSHCFQLYRHDPWAAQIKFMEWWEKKAGERSLGGGVYAE